MERRVRDKRAASVINAIRRTSDAPSLDADVGGRLARRRTRDQTSPPVCTCVFGSSEEGGGAMCLAGRVCGDESSNPI